MISSSLILSLIAFLFLRIQIRAIQRLAKSAKDLGEGKKIKKFKPEGALEIRQAGNSFIRMKKKINEYISQRTSFLAGISHDLGTILTRIKLRLELMDNDEHIKSIKNDLKTMQMVLREYLDYSEKINISRLSSVNIYELISDVINSSTILTKKSKISCNKKIFYRTDRNCLYRIIFNICENGAKFANNIKIKATKNLKFLRIEIEDDGPGIRDSFKKKFSNHSLKLTIQETLIKVVLDLV